MKEILRKPRMKVGICPWGTKTWTIKFFDHSTFKNKKKILKFKSKLVYSFWSLSYETIVILVLVISLDTQTLC